MWLICPSTVYLLRRAFYSFFLGPGILVRCFVFVCVIHVGGLLYTSVVLFLFHPLLPIYHYIVVGVWFLLCSCVVFVCSQWLVLSGIQLWHFCSFFVWMLSFHACIILSRCSCFRVLFIWWPSCVISSCRSCFCMRVCSLISSLFPHCLCGFSRLDIFSLVVPCRWEVGSFGLVLRIGLVAFSHSYLTSCVVSCFSFFLI